MVDMMIEIIEIKQKNYTSTTVHFLFKASCLMTGERYRGIAQPQTQPQLLLSLANVQLVGGAI